MGGLRLLVGSGGRARVAVVAVGVMVLWALALGGSAAALPSNCSQAGSTVTCSYSYTGDEQSFVVPGGVSRVQITAVGAYGGRSATSPGGAGGTARAMVSAAPGSTLLVEVGGPGHDSCGGSIQGGGGSFDGGNGACPGGDNQNGAGGGGSSSVKTSGGEILVVAGGGGGAGGAGGTGSVDASGGGGGAAGVGGGGGGADSNGDGGGGGGGPGGSFGGGGGGGGIAAPPSSSDGDPGTAGGAFAGGDGGWSSWVGSGGGGGGGGGYYGGGGGGAGGAGGGSNPNAAYEGGAGGGGGGGSSYAPIGATGVAAMGTPPSVTISYTVPATATTDGSKPAPSRVVREVTHVPAKTLDKVGTGRVSLRVQKLSGKRLESGGKPEGLALTLAWCPHCAANSWSYAIALSRFGKLSGLRVINAGTYYEHHGGKPGYPDAHGLSFFHTTYHSKYLKFVDVIEQNVEGENLETPTAREQAAFNSFDPHGSAPALDVGGIYGFVGAGYTPGLLGKQGWAKIAGVLAHAKGKLGRSIDGFANVLTAMFCKATKDRPASVCASKGVKAAAKLLPS